MAHNSHPLRSNLVQRGMKIDYNFPICGEIGEDGGHLFFKCRLAKEIWSRPNLDRERVALAATVLVRHAVEMILKSKEDCKLLMITAIWIIWSEHNLIKEEGRRRSAKLIE